MKPHFKKYKTVLVDVRVDQNQPIPPNCFDYLLINQGDTNVTVNNLLLKGYPPGHPELTGASFSPDANEDEVLTMDGFFIVFDTAPMVAPHLQIVFRIYIEHWP